MPLRLWNRKKPELREYKTVTHNSGVAADVKMPDGQAPSGIFFGDALRGPLGSARVPRVGEAVSGSRTFGKLVSARRRNQRARRARYPELEARGFEPLTSS